MQNGQSKEGTEEWKEKLQKKISEEEVEERKTNVEQLPQLKMKCVSAEWKGRRLSNKQAAHTAAQPDTETRYEASAT